jgi:hypothetical protein
MAELTIPFNDTTKPLIEKTRTPGDRRTAYLGILKWQRRFIPDQGHALGSGGRRSILALEASIYGPDSTKAPFGLVSRTKVVSDLLTLRSTIQTKQRLRDSDVGSLNLF